MDSISEQLSIHHTGVTRKWAQLSSGQRHSLLKETFTKFQVNGKKYITTADIYPVLQECGVIQSSEKMKASVLKVVQEEDVEKTGQFDFVKLCDIIVFFLGPLFLTDADHSTKTKTREPETMKVFTASDYKEGNNKESDCYDLDKRIKMAKEDSTKAFEAWQSAHGIFSQETLSKLMKDYMKKRDELVNLRNKQRNKNKTTIQALPKLSMQYKLYSDVETSNPLLRSSMIKQQQEQQLDDTTVQNQTSFDSSSTELLTTFQEEFTTRKSKNNSEQSTYQTEFVDTLANVTDTKRVEDILASPGTSETTIGAYTKSLSPRSEQFFAKSRNIPKLSPTNISATSYNSPISSPMRSPTRYSFSLKSLDNVSEEYRRRSDNRRRLHSQEQNNLLSYIDSSISPSSSPRKRSPKTKSPENKKFENKKFEKYPSHAIWTKLLRQCDEALAATNVPISAALHSRLLSRDIKTCDKKHNFQSRSNNCDNESIATTTFNINRTRFPETNSTTPNRTRFPETKTAQSIMHVATPHSKRHPQEKKKITTKKVAKLGTLYRRVDEFGNKNKIAEDTEMKAYISDIVASRESMTERKATLGTNDKNAKLGTLYRRVDEFGNKNKIAEGTEMKAYISDIVASRAKLFKNVESK